MIPGLELLLSLALASQPAPAESNMPASAAARLDFMKASLASYALRPLDIPERSYRLQSEPVLRFTNPVGGLKDGAVFLWLDSNDRPAAAVQVYWTARQQRYLQEFSSLATGPMVADSADEPDWRPASAGVEFQRVPDAPRPVAVGSPGTELEFAL